LYFLHALVSRDADFAIWSCGGEDNFNAGVGGKIATVSFGIEGRVFTAGEHDNIGKNDER